MAIAARDDDGLGSNKQAATHAKAANEQVLKRSANGVITTACRRACMSQEKLRVPMTASNAALHFVQGYHPIRRDWNDPSLDLEPGTVASVIKVSCSSSARRATTYRDDNSGLVRVVDSWQEAMELCHEVLADCLPIPPSLTDCWQSQPQWKKGKFLGSGTYGMVYLGFNSKNGQYCAIKEVKVIPDDSHSKEQLKQLNQEIQMLSKLSHPNIVKYLGSNLTDDTLSIYLEYVSEGSIHTLLQKHGPFKEHMIRNYTRQILCGLAYLHRKKTVHRDIKGGNILVNSTGAVKLADFGTAKYISSFAEIHSTKGTAYWMAPEVILSTCSGKGYNRAADIWSLGCTVIEMATGKHPGHEDCIAGQPCNPIAGIFRTAKGNGTPKIPESLSEDGKDFLKRCLERDPARRYSANRLLNHPFIRSY